MGTIKAVSASAFGAGLYELNLVKGDPKPTFPTRSFWAIVTR
jgi:hypothetical protein